MKIQFALPFKEAKKLPQDQLSKILKHQARRLALSESEISSLHDICYEKKCLDKGLGVLYEFSGYVDRIFRLIEKRRKMSILISSHFSSSASIDVFVSDLTILAETSAKLIHALSMWRKLNLNPRPIYSDQDPAKPLDSILPTTFSNRSSLQNSLREEAYRLMSSAQHSQIDIFSCLSLGVLVVLLSSVMQMEEFQSILNSRCVSLPGEDNPASIELPHSLVSTFNGIRNVLFMEDDIESSWVALEAGHCGTDTPAMVISSFPIIRIGSKDEETGVYGGLDWFPGALATYTRSISALTSEIRSGSLSTTGLTNTSLMQFNTSMTSLDMLGGDSLVLAGSSLDSPTGSPDFHFSDHISSPAVNTTVVSPQKKRVDGGTGTGSGTGTGTGTGTGDSEEPIEPKDVITTVLDTAIRTVVNNREEETGVQVSVRSLSATSVITEAPVDSSRARVASAPSGKQSSSKTAQGVAKLNATSTRKTAASSVSGKVLGSKDAKALGTVAVAGAQEETANKTGPRPQSGAKASLHLPAQSSTLRSGKGAPASTSSQATSASSAIGAGLSMRHPSEVAEVSGAYDSQSSPSKQRVGSSVTSEPDGFTDHASFDLSTPLRPLGRPAHSSGKGLTTPPGGTSPSRTRGAATTPKQPDVFSSPSGEQVVVHYYPVFHSPQELAQYTAGLPQGMYQPSMSAAPGRPFSGQGPPSSNVGMNSMIYPRGLTVGAYAPSEEDIGIIQRTPQLSFSTTKSSSSASMTHENSSSSLLSSTRPQSVETRLRASSADSRAVRSGPTAVPSPHSTPQRSHSKTFKSKSKSMESLGILQSVSSTSFRGESLVDSQVISLAFKYIDMGGGTLLHLAAKKVAVWWRFFYPRRKLLRRMSIRCFLMDIVYDMANKAVTHSIIVNRRRKKFLWEGSAIKIQRVFRNYRDTVLAEEKAQELIERKQTAQENLQKFCKVICACIQVYRFVKFVHKRYCKKKVRMPTFAYVTDLFLLRVKDARLREALVHISSNSKQLFRHMGRAKAYHEREQAAVRLQVIARAILSKKIFRKLKYERAQKRKMRSFMYKAMYFVRRRKRRIRNAAAIMIQKHVRGMILRCELTRRVKAGMLLNGLWRKHRAFRTLKQNLRRVEKPAKIILRGLRNIPAQLVHTDALRVKISVWWHPLLHIISESDFGTIIQNKQPQFVYTTRGHSLAKEIKFDASAADNSVHSGASTMDRVSASIFGGSSSPLKLPGRFMSPSASPSVSRQGSTAEPLALSRNNSAAEPLSRSGSAVVDPTAATDDRKSPTDSKTYPLSKLPSLTEEPGKPDTTSPGSAQSPGSHFPSPGPMNGRPKKLTPIPVNNFVSPHRQTKIGDGGFSGARIAFGSSDGPAAASASADSSAIVKPASGSDEVESFPLVAVNSSMSALSDSSCPPDSFPVEAFGSIESLESSTGENSVSNSTRRLSKSDSSRRMSKSRSSRSLKREKSKSKMASDESTAAVPDAALSAAASAAATASYPPATRLAPLNVDVTPSPHGAAAPQTRGTMVSFNQTPQIHPTITPIIKPVSRVARSTTFLRGRIGTMLAPQLTPFGRPAPPKDAAAQEDAEKESDEEDEDDEDSDYSSSSSSSSESNDSNAPVEAVVPKKTVVRNTLLKNIQFMSRGSKIGDVAGSRRGQTSFLQGISSQIRKTVTRVVTGGTRIGVRRKKQKDTEGLIQPKFYCHFDDEMIRIPGCHGNSVVKFEFLDGERKVASHLFFMAKEGTVMFWGGSYARSLHISQARRQGQVNARLLSNDHKFSQQVPENPNLPLFEFSVTSGAALKSRAQWGKVAVKGNGPAKRAAHRNIFTAFFFTSWRKLYLSMDDDGLSIFERKSHSTPLVFISVRDMETVHVEQAAGNVSKGSRAEDSCVVVLATKLRDEIYIRLPDVASRFGWHDAIAKAIADFKASDHSKTHNNVITNSMALTRKLTTMVAHGASNLMSKRGVGSFAVMSLGSATSETSMQTAAIASASASASASMEIQDIPSSAPMLPSAMLAQLPSRGSRKPTNLPTVMEADSPAKKENDDDNSEEDACENWFHAFYKHFTSQMQSQIAEMALHLHSVREIMPAELHSIRGEGAVNPVSPVVSKNSKTMPGLSSQLNILLELAMEKERGNFSFESPPFEFTQVTQLFKFLDYATCDKLRASDPSLLSTIAHQLGVYLVHSACEFDIEAEYCASQDSGQSSPRSTDSAVLTWLSAGRPGHNVLGKITARISACCLTLRLLFNQPIGILDLSAEHVEKALELISTCLDSIFVCSFSSSSGSKSSSCNSPNPSSANISVVEDENLSKKSPSRGSDSPTKRPKSYIEPVKIKKSKLKPDIRRLLIETARELLPLFHELLYTLEAWLGKSKQRDRIVVAVFKLAYTVISLDPSSNARVECLEQVFASTAPGSRSPSSSLHHESVSQSLSSPLVKLQKQAISLCRLVFQLYPTHRVQMINDLFPLLSQVYAPKLPNRSYSITSLSNGGGVALSKKELFSHGNQFISMPLAALLVMLQSVDAAAETAPSGSALVDTPLLPTPTGSDSASIEAGKGTKRGRSKESTVSDSTVEVAQDQIGQQQSKKQGDNSNMSLIGCKRVCSFFISELIKRFEHKDLNAEYKSAAVHILDDCLQALLCLHLPVSSILLDLFLHRILLDLKAASTMSSSASEGSLGKKDSSYIVLCLDLVGQIGQHIRPIVVESQSYRENVDQYDFPSNIVKILESKFKEIQLFWLNETEGALAVDKELLSESRRPKATKKGKKATAPSSATSLSADAYTPKLDVHTKLQLLADVSASTLETVTSTEVESSESKKRNVALIDPIAMLSYLKIDQLLRNVDEISCVDHCAHLFNDYITQSLNPMHIQDQADEKNDFIDNCRDVGPTQTGIGGILSDAKRLSLLIWYADAHRRASINVKAYIEGIYNRPDLYQTSSFLESESKRIYFSQKYVNLQYQQSLVTRLLAPQFEAILSTVLLMFSNPVPGVRSRVMKTLARLIQSDPSLISRAAVKDAVTERFNDIAISVREEAVKLVGSYVLRGCEISDAYLEGILIRLRDKGVSVRKTVVGIIRDILLFQPMHPRYTELCLNLLERGAMPKEEDSIRETIRSTFQAVWFLPSSVEPSDIHMHAVKMTSPRIQKDIQDEVVTNPALIGVSAQELIDSDDCPSAALVLPLGWTIEDRQPSAPSPSARASQRRITSAATNTGGPSASFLYDMVSADGKRFQTMEEALRHIGLSTNALELLQQIQSSSIALFSSASVSWASKLLYHTSSSRTSPMISDSVDTALPLPLPSAASSLAEAVVRDPILATALQIVDVVSRLSNLDWMVALIRELLHGRALSGEDAQKSVLARRQSSEQHCRKLVDVLIENLLRAEEGDESLVMELQDKRSVSEHIVEIIHTLSVFCEAHPPLVIPHLSTLLPYLKGHLGLNPQQDASVCLEVTKILESASVMDRGTAGIRPQEVCDDLTAISLKYGPLNVSSAIGCMCMLAANVTRDVSPIIKLAQKCFFAILTVAREQRSKSTSTGNGSGTLNQAQLGRLQRCLLVFGAICEHSRKIKPLLYADIQDDSSQDSGVSHKAVPKDEDVAKLDMLSINTVTRTSLCGACYAAARFALAQGDVSLQARSVQALCSVFIGCPRIILQTQDSGLLAKLFSSFYPSSVHEKLLLSLTAMMHAEEKRLELGAALTQMKSSGIEVAASRSQDRLLVSADSESDATVAGFMLQQYLPHLLTFTTSQAPTVRYAALCLLGTLLRQGMLCPLDLFSRLIGLQGDPDSAIRSEALRILQLEDERHPSFLDNRMVEGIEAAFVHQKTVMSTGPQPLDGVATEACDGSGSVGVSSIFKPLFVSCIQANRKRKLEFFSGVLRRAFQLTEQLKAVEFSLRDCRSSGVEACTLADMQHKSDLLVYLITTLAHIPFELNDEPLYIIYWISRNVPIPAGLLLGRMREGLLQVGGRDRGPASAMLPPALGQKLSATPTALAPTTGLTGSAPGNKRHAWDDGLLFDNAHFNQYFESGASTRDILCSTIAQSFQVLSLECMLRLKSFLKVAYSLSDERCQCFNPEDRPSSLLTISIADGPDGDTSSAAGASAAIANDKARLIDLSTLQPFSASADSDAHNLTPTAVLASQLADGVSVAAVVQAAGRTEIETTAKQAIRRYNSLLVLLDGDPDDFTLAKKKARGRKALQNSDTDAIDSKEKKKKKTATANKKKKRKDKDSVDRDYDDFEQDPFSDDDDDE